MRRMLASAIEKLLSVRVVLDVCRTIFSGWT